MIIVSCSHLSAGYKEQMITMMLVALLVRLNQQINKEQRELERYIDGDNE